MQLQAQSTLILSKIFDQYLRTIKIPVLEYKFAGDNMSYRWNNVIEGFSMPVKIAGTDEWLKPNSAWTSTAVTGDIKNNGLKIDRNFYITIKKVE